MGYPKCNINCCKLFGFASFLLILKLYSHVNAFSTTVTTRQRITISTLSSTAAVSTTTTTTTTRMTMTETVFKTKAITPQQQQWTALRAPVVLVTTIHQLLSNTAGLLFESLFDTTPASKGVYYDIRTDDHHHPLLSSSPSSDSSRKSKGEQTETIEPTKNKDDNYKPSWVPSDRENHHDKLPSAYVDKSSSHEIIINDNAEDGRTLRLLKQKSFSHKQGKVSNTTTKLASLPLRVAQTAPEQPQPGKYASNHIMINNERRKRKIPPLRREHYLDTLARNHATAMASHRSLFHMDTPHELLTRIQHELQEETTTKDDDAEDSYYVPQRIGMNIASGTSIATIHKFMMAALAERNNMRDKRFCLMGMGMGIARAPDADEEGGKTGGGDDVLYLCQIFAG